MAENFLDRSTSWVLGMPRVFKRVLVLAVDACLCVLAVWIAFYLRLGEWVSPADGASLASVVSMLIGIPVFIAFGLYRHVFRHVGWPALASTAQACFVYAIAYATVFTAWTIPNVPRTIGTLQPLLLFLFVGTSRYFAQLWLGGAYRIGLGGARSRERKNVLIFGAGTAGRHLASALGSSPEFKLIAYIDDDDDLHGRLMNGTRVWPRSKLQTLIEEHDISELFLAIPSASRRTRTEIIDYLQRFPLSIRTLPGLIDLARGTVTVSDLQPLAIEDLLGRDAVSPNSLLLQKNIAGKTVLVTGAGGSIGSEICRQVLHIRPMRLIMVDVSEFNLYSIHQELTLLAEGSGIELIPILASVRSESRMAEIFAAWRPHTVYHAAAYKHVPLVEHNVCEGVLNNVFGTLIAAQSAAEAGVADFVLISTDKAVRPTNVMGASKRLAEMCLQALACSSKTRFSMVRFGNVLGSSGSVVPLFREQIAKGGPVTVTHPEITRYFMTIPEAAQLVIQAGAMARGGEVFVLDMGEPVRIVDLAVRMIELSGLSVANELTGSGDIEIKFVGLRPGEKLYEELLIGENPRPTAHPLIMMAEEQFLPWRDLQSELRTIRRDSERGEAAGVKSQLAKLVTGFTPHENMVDLTYGQRSAIVA